MYLGNAQRFCGAAGEHGEARNALSLVNECQVTTINFVVLIQSYIRSCTWVMHDPSVLLQDSVAGRAAGGHVSSRDRAGLDDSFGGSFVLVVGQ